MSKEKKARDLENKMNRLIRQMSDIHLEITNQTVFPTRVDFLLHQYLELSSEHLIHQLELNEVLEKKSFIKRLFRR